MEGWRERGRGVWTVMLGGMVAACVACDGGGTDAGAGERRDGGGGAAGGGGSGWGGNTTECVIRFFDPACEQCMAGACQGACVACQNDEDCTAIVQCTFGCATGRQCIEACVEGNRGGESLYAAYLNRTSGCLGTKCAEACGIDSKECELGSSDPVCDGCLNERCLEPCRACAGSVDCTRALECAEDCGADQGCIDGCKASESAGWEAMVALVGTSGCLATQCSLECD